MEQLNERIEQIDDQLDDLLDEQNEKMEQINKYNIVLDTNNEIRAYIPYSKLQEKFSNFLQSDEDDEDTDYSVEIHDDENFNILPHCKFASELNFWNSLSDLNDTIIDLSDFTRLKKIILTKNLNNFLFPENLKELHITELYFNEELNNLPSGLKILNITSNCFDHNFNNLNNLPSLSELYINGSYLQPLNHLPPSLKKLCFHPDQMYSHDFNNLPNSIIELDVNEIFLDNINILPLDLKKITCWLSKICHHTTKTKTQIIEIIKKCKNYRNDIEIIFN